MLKVLLNIFILSKTWTAPDCVVVVVYNITIEAIGHAEIQRNDITKDSIFHMLNMRSVDKWSFNALKKRILN